MPDLSFAEYRATSGGKDRWLAGRLPHGSWICVVPINCNAADTHWVVCMEDPDLCDCELHDQVCAFCMIRASSGTILSRITGCYRSRKSAVRALQQRVNHSQGTMPPAPWHCDWTFMRALVREDDPEAPPIPLTGRPLSDGDPTDFIALDAQAAVHSPSGHSLCHNDHWNARVYWVQNDETPTLCPMCGLIVDFTNYSVAKNHHSQDHYGLPETVTRQWLLENSDKDNLGDVPIPHNRRGGLFTHVRYEPDCEDGQDSDNLQDESLKWTVTQYLIKRDLATKPFGQRPKPHLGHDPTTRSGNATSTPMRTHRSGEDAINVTFP